MVKSYMMASLSFKTILFGEKDVTNNLSAQREPCYQPKCTDVDVEVSMRRLAIVYGNLLSLLGSRRLLSP